jgi:hypothetical protein
MNKIKYLLAYLTLTSMLFPSGCQHHGSAGGADAIIEVESIYHSTNCLPDQIEPQAFWVASPAELQKLWKNIHHSRLGVPPVLPEVNFNTHGILLVHMGQQRTGGYALELAEPLCRVKNGIVSVAVNWISPEPGTVASQAITSPCILLRLPKGDFRAIAVIDQNGTTRVVVECQR